MYFSVFCSVYSDYYLIVSHRYCPFLSNDGTVKHEYIDRWTPQSSLSELMTLLASAFGAYPPLATVKSQSVTESVTTGLSQVVSSATNFASNAFNKLSQAGKPSNPPPASGNTAPPASNSGSASSATPFVDPWAATDKLTPAQERQCLVDMVHVQMDAAWKTANTGVRDKTVEYEQEKGRLMAAVAAAEMAAQAKAKDSNEAKQTYDMVLQESTNLNSWIGAFETRTPTVFCANTRQEQVLNAIAEDRTYDNAMDAVRELFKQKKVSIETYMQHIRQLSMRQFNARALAMQAAGDR